MPNGRNGSIAMLMRRPRASTNSARVRSRQQAIRLRLPTKPTKNRNRARMTSLTCHNGMP